MVDNTKIKNLNVKRFMDVSLNIGFGKLIRHNQNKTLK